MLAEKVWYILPYKNCGTRQFYTNPPKSFTTDYAWIKQYISNVLAKKQAEINGDKSKRDAVGSETEYRRRIYDKEKNGSCEDTRSKTLHSKTYSCGCIPFTFILSVGMWEIGKQLGMRPEEVFRLSDFSKEDFLTMMANKQQVFSKAEFITKY